MAAALIIRLAVANAGKQGNNITHYLNQKKASATGGSFFYLPGCRNFPDAVRLSGDSNELCFLKYKKL
jgi:hypothetical protein